MTSIELAQIDSAIEDLKARLADALSKSEAVKANVITSKNSVESAKKAFDHFFGRLHNIRSQDLVDLEDYAKLREDVANCVDWLDQFRMEHARAVSDLAALTSKIEELREAIGFLAVQRQGYNQVVPFVSKA